MRVRIYLVSLELSRANDLCEINRRGHDDGRAYPLGRGNAEKRAAQGVPAQEFQQEAANGVYKKIQSEEVSAQCAFSHKASEYEKQSEVEQRLQKLYGEALYKVGFGKERAPERKADARFNSIAAAAQKAAYAPEGVKQRGRRGEDIGVEARV